jgi:colanic acid/amylovoran biosynthesis glycosyltransferase
MFQIAITQPNGGTASETFIRNDIKYLAAYAQVHNLAGGWIPYLANDQPLIAAWVATLEKGVARLFGKEFIHFLTARRVKNYLKVNKIQVVVAKYGPGGVAMMPICKALNIPLLVHFHGLDLVGHKILQRYEADYKTMFQTAAGILIVSENQRSLLEEMGCPAHKIHYAIYGADATWADLKPQFEQLIFLAVGRFTPKKAPQHTIAAFAQVVAIHPTARLIMVGDGELMPFCQQLVQDLKIEQHVEFLGNQPPARVAELMRSACCFVQHSITASDGDMEGSPVAIIEAGMVGLPVVSTVHAGIPDIVVDKETGFLVAENDVDAMADAMKKIAIDLNFAKKLGDNALNRIASHFSIPICVEREWKVIQQFL